MEEPKQIVVRLEWPRYTPLYDYREVLSLLATEDIANRAPPEPNRHERRKRKAMDRKRKP